MVPDFTDKLNKFGILALWDGVFGEIAGPLNTPPMKMLSLSICVAT